MTAVCLNPARAAISVGPGGSGVISFGTAPTVAEGWSTAPIAGTGPTIFDTAGLDAAVQLLSAASITTVLPTSATVPPSTSALGFRYNTTSLNIQSRATTVSATVLLATLQNDSGANQSALTVTYTLGSGQLITEQIPGFRAYYSLSGAAGSWVVIPGLSTDVPGVVSTVVNPGTWTAGTTMYLLWADDNADPGTDGHYTIDDFSVTLGGVVTENVVITSPTNTAVFSQGVPITINASAAMAGAITGVDFYHDGILIGNDASSPYSVIYSNATLGAHTLTAVASDNTHSITSTIVNITINPNTAPTVTITNPISGSNYIVGVTVTNISASASDVDGTIARVEFYLDGALWSTDTTSPYSFDLCDITAGSHTISAVAVDNGNAHSTNSISIVATNPPGVTVIVANGSAWKYLDDGSDQGTAWYAAVFNDSGWSNGVAELGYGDAQGRPERTTVGFGPNANTKYPTTYFRKTFNVANPGSFSGLTLNVLADDHFIVYLNGVEVFRDMTNAVVNYLTLENPAVAHDGTVYVNTNLATSALVAGANTVAVEVHQDSITSSDISFDLMLWGNASAGPKLTVVQTDATHVQVSWGADAVGYTLQINTTDVGNTGAWSNLGGAIAGAGSTTVSFPPNLKFFRLINP